MTATTLEYQPFLGDLPASLSPAPTASQRRSPRAKTPEGASTNTYVVPDSIEDEFDKHFKKLEELRRTPSLVPSGAEAPSTSVIEGACDILCVFQMNGLVPTRVVASAESGVAICFVQGDNYSDVEYLNTGEILGVTSNRHDRPSVWEIRPGLDDVMQAAYRIRRFLNQSSSKKNVAKRSSR